MNETEKRKKLVDYINGMGVEEKIALHKRTKTMSKRTTYIDGWHKKNENLSFRVEGGRLCNGVWKNDSGTEQKQVFPYVFDKKLGCYNNAYGIRAYYGVLKRIRWF